jgi:uncharacterized membrane protein YhhN
MKELLRTESPKVKYFSLLYLIVATGEIITTIQQNQLLEFIFKPLLMVSLAALYLVSVKKPSFIYVSALFFSFWGDVLLLFPEKYFIIGLVSFLLTHILFIRFIFGGIVHFSLIKFLKAFVIFGSYFGIIVSIIHSNLNEMFFPVIAYGTVISIFGSFALMNYTQDTSSINLWLLLGALFFIVSDSIIALNKFYLQNASMGTIIMLTYILAQYFICKAIIGKSAKSTI